MTIRDFATENNLCLHRDSAGDLIVPGRRTTKDMPKQRDYANHVYDGFADGRLGICLLFTTRKKWTTTRRTLELAGCLLKQNGDTEGCLTFDPTNAEQVRAVVKAGGLKARRMASPERLVHLASARLRRVANPPIEDRRWGFCGEKALYDPTHCSGGRAMKLSDFTHNFTVGSSDWGTVQYLSLEDALEINGTFSGEIKTIIKNKDMDIGVVLYQVMPDGELFHLSYFFGRASYARDMSVRHLLSPGATKPFRSIARE